MFKKFLAILFLVFLVPLGVAQAKPVSVVQESINIPSSYEDANLSIKYPRLLNPKGLPGIIAINTHILNDVMSVANKFPKDVAANDRYVLDINYEVSFNDGDNLSIIRDSYRNYKGAAHPSSSKLGLNFNVKSGNFIPFTAVISGPTGPRFSVNGINQMLAASPPGRQNAFYKDFKGLKDYPTNYYIAANKNIHLVFQQYEIAPYAVGIIDIDTNIKF